ncbi:hypothetical protein BDZ89DRAFT_1073591, partial [Hymenopellis radicata]
MSSLKRPAEEDAPASETTAHTAAPAPSHLFVVLVDEEHGGGLDSAHEGPRPLGVARTITGATELLKSLHDAYEAKNLKEGETPEEFDGLDTANKKGKLVGEASIGDMQARVEKWKVAEGKTRATTPEAIREDAKAASPDTTVHYAYTILYSWSDYYGDTGAHTFGGVALTPSYVPGLVCAKLPCKGLTAMKFPPDNARDGVLVAEGRDSKTKGKKYAGVARRWIVRDWEKEEEGRRRPQRVRRPDNHH